MLSCRNCDAGFGAQAMVLSRLFTGCCELRSVEGTMKPMMAVSACLLTLSMGTAVAVPDECQQLYKQDVNACTQDVLKGTDLKVCLANARSVRATCESGVGDPGTLPDEGPVPVQCEVSCQENHPTQVAACEASFSTAQCNGDPACEAFALSLQAGCKQTADVDLQACLAGCGSE
jgi:hypothetical protein